MYTCPWAGRALQSTASVAWSSLLSSAMLLASAPCCAGGNCPGGTVLQWASCCTRAPASVRPRVMLCLCSRCTRPYGCLDLRHVYIACQPGPPHQAVAGKPPPLAAFTRQSERRALRSRLVNVMLGAAFPVESRPVGHFYGPQYAGRSVQLAPCLHVGYSW